MPRKIKKQIEVEPTQPKSCSSTVMPEFKVGTIYRTVGDTAVRKGPGFHNGVKLNLILMTDGKRRKLNANGELEAGTPVLCKEVTKGAGDQIWVRCPSGWVIGYCGGQTLLI